MMMNEISLIEALKDCTTTCGWCIQHCPDEDKYEVLVSYIRIQRECIELCKAVNLILVQKAPESMEKIVRLLELLAESMQKNQKAMDSSTPESAKDYAERWKIPGCSQLFLISQLLEQAYNKGHE